MSVTKITRTDYEFTHKIKLADFEVELLVSIFKGCGLFTATKVARLMLPHVSILDCKSIVEELTKE